MKKLNLIALIIALITSLNPLAAAAESRSESQKIRFFDAKTFEQKGEVVLPDYYDDLSFDVGDYGVDGEAELLLANSAGMPPEVVLQRIDGSEIKRWSVYSPNYLGGVRVIGEDINLDGRRDIITATRSGGGPHLKVFSVSEELISEWFAYDPEETAGFTVAAGELLASANGPEIVTANDAGNPTRIRVFSRRGELLSEWYPFGEQYRDGVNLDVGPNATLIASKKFSSPGIVRAFSGNGVLVQEFLPYFDGFAGGVDVTTVGNSQDWQIITSPGYSGSAHILPFSLQARQLSPGSIVYPDEYKSGTVIASADIEGDGQKELFVGQSLITNAPDDSIKSIKVNLKDQTLTRYYKGIEDKRYLISSGLDRFPTPIGKFSISRKRELTRMAWVYGPGHPENYDLPDVPHAMTFIGPYNIHGAYWHNNFGNQMSHGCVNMSLPDAEDLFNWTDIGTAIVVE